MRSKPANIIIGFIAKATCTPGIVAPLPHKDLSKYLTQLPPKPPANAAQHETYPRLFKQISSKSDRRHLALMKALLEKMNGGSGNEI